MTRCGHCGYRADPGEEECPLCGSPLEVGDEAGRQGGAAREARSGDGEPGGEPGGPASWDRGQGRFPDDFLRAWKESLFSPSGFFTDLRAGSSLARALLYYLVFVLVGTAFSVFWNLSLGGIGEAGRIYEMLGFTPGQYQILGLFAAPFLALLFLGFFAVAYHLLVMLLVDGHGGFRETARVLCYAWSGPQLFQAVPLVGGLISGVWSLVLMVVGVREHHGTSTGRAAAVVLIPVFLVFAVPVVVLTIAIMMGALGGAFPNP